MGSPQEKEETTMKGGRYFFPAILSAGMSVSSHSARTASPAGIAGELEAAFLSKKAYPVISTQVEGLTVDRAYEIQAEFVKRREVGGEAVAGYKAGLTAGAVQRAFGLKEAVRGTLFKSMLHRAGTLHRKDFAGMFIETEIGYRFGRDITEPVDDIGALERAVDMVFPAVELPDLTYTDIKELKGTDLIATNVAARRVLIGEAAGAGDLNAVTVRLFHDGREVTSGEGKNSLGDQWEALKWTVNNVLTRGGEVKSGYIVITGAISEMVRAEPGRYSADYGDFGKIEFEYR
jgi:2-oxo-hept-3-ene-1,7-dioate hydratase